MRKYNFPLQNLRCYGKFDDFTWRPRGKAPAGVRWVDGSIPQSTPIELFPIPTSAPRLVYWTICSESVNLGITSNQHQVLNCGKEGFYLTTHSTHYIYGYMESDMVKDHSDIERRNPLPSHRLIFPISSKRSIAPRANALTISLPKRRGDGVNFHRFSNKVTEWIINIIPAQK